jgi:GDP-mannose 6-dehydrogenase
MIKYVNNTFHALKVTFANEVGRVCHQFGVDGTKVMELFCQDTKLNLSPYYLRPGFSFGGSCLPKDTRALATFGNRAETELIDAILPANEAHTQAAVRRIRERDPDTVGVLGLSFKSGTNDMRHSPAVALVRDLLDGGRDVVAFDPDVITADLVGSNRSFVERKLPEIDELLVNAPEDLFSRADLVVVCTDNESFGDLLAASDVAVYDLVGALRDRRDNFRDYESLC